MEKRNQIIAMLYQNMSKVDADDTLQLIDELCAGKTSNENAVLPIHDVSGLLLDLRQAVADYMYSEGCICCQDIEAHREHKKRLAELMNVEPYDDKSGYDFLKYRKQ